MQEEAENEGVFKLFDEMQLQEFSDKFLIRSTNSPEEAFSIDRNNGDIQPLTTGQISSFLCNSYLIIQFVLQIILYIQ
ncbi:hypothetical protein ACHQM5_021898 [Ranunculus cassubicifolius]